MKKEISQAVKAKHQEYDGLRKQEAAAFQEVKMFYARGDYQGALRPMVKTLELKQKADSVATEIYNKNKLRYGRFSRKHKSVSKRK